MFTFTHPQQKMRCLGTLLTGRQRGMLVTAKRRKPLLQQRSVFLFVFHNLLSYVHFFPPILSNRCPVVLLSLLSLYAKDSINPIELINNICEYCLLYNTYPLFYDKLSQNSSCWCWRKLQTEITCVVQWQNTQPSSQRMTAGASTWFCYGWWEAGEGSHFCCWAPRWILIPRLGFKFRGNWTL